MIWLLIPAAAVGGALIVWLLWLLPDWQAKRRKAAERVKALNAIVDEAMSEKAALPDPERDLNEKDVNDAINRARALGRKPL